MANVELLRQTMKDSGMTVSAIAEKSGFAPMLHGFIISLLVVIVAIAVEYFMGIV